MDKKKKCCDPIQPQFSPRATSASTTRRSAADTSVCSPVSIMIPANQSSCQTSPASGGFDVYQTFDMIASFSNVAPAACSACQYRQYVRGNYYTRLSSSDPWTANQPYVHGDNGYLDTGFPCPFLNQEYAQDGCGIFGNLRYGWRSDPDPNHCNDNYYDDSAHTQTDRQNGCYYLGHDKPQLYVPTGYQYQLSCDFKAEIIDNSGNIVAGPFYWIVSCSNSSQPLIERMVASFIKTSKPFKTRSYSAQAFLVRLEQGKFAANVAISQLRENYTRPIFSKDIEIGALAKNGRIVKCVRRDRHTLPAAGKHCSMTSHAYFYVEDSDPESVETVKFTFGGQTHSFQMKEYSQKKVSK